MNQKGIALIITFMVIVVLIILSTAIIHRSISENSITKNYIDSMQAFWLAEAGLNRALKELSDDFGLRAGTNLWRTELGSGGYYVDVGEVSGRSRSVSAYGFVSAQAPFRAERILTATVSREQFSFSHAIFGDTGIGMGGSAIVDSYNSNQGPYIGTPIQRNGNIGTNSITNGSINIGGSAILYGNITVGPGGDPNRVVTTSGSVIITGQKLASAALKPMLPASPPEGVSSRGRLFLAGSTNMVLSAGIYRYSSITIAGSSTLSTSGRATIYVDGSVTVAGGSVVGANNRPTNLTIIVLGQNNITFAGSNRFYGSVYAPLAQMTVAGSVQFYGALAARRVTVAGSARFHYDEALSSQETESGTTVGITSWQETPRGSGLCQ